MKKKFLSLILALAMILSMTTALSYATEVSGYNEETVTVENAEARSTTSTSFSTKRFSDTKAAASAGVIFSKTADKYTVAVVLQKKSGDSWVTATDVYGSVHYYRGTNKSSVLTDDTWNVKDGGLYRVKCISTDSYDNGASYTYTAYSSSF